MCKWRKFSRALLITVACLFTGCNTGSVRSLQKASDTAQLTEAESRSWHAAGELEETWLNKGLIYDDPELTNYVQVLSDKLYPEFKGTLRLYIVDSPELNAFALPNGSVYLNMGLISRMRNEAQLATVLGHEISHFTHQHSLQQRNAVDSIYVAGMTVTLLTGVPVVGQLLAAGAMSGYSQDLEREADKLGFARLVENGYDVAEAASVFRIMLQEVEALDIDQPVLYSSHPKLSERIETMEQLGASHQSSNSFKNEQYFNDKTKDLRAVVLERYLKTHRYKTLILILENPVLRERYPDYASYYLAEAYRQRDQDGDRKLAEYAYRQTLIASPRFAPTHRGLGLLLMKQGEDAAAVSHLETYLALAPQAMDRGYVNTYINKLRN